MREPRGPRLDERAGRRSFEPRFEERRVKRFEPSKDRFRDKPPSSLPRKNQESYKVEGRKVESTQDTPTGFAGERIAKVIARIGLGSRRDVEAWIEAGRVAVNGEILRSAARNVTPSDRILIDGNPLPRRERTRLWLYHKPRGLVTTEKDPEGRPTVFSRLPPHLPRVVSVGRLDINTEGLLLLTNDGGLARLLELPKTGWMRRYRVRAHGDTDQGKLDELFSGVSVEGVDYGPIEARLDKTQGANIWLTIGLREGKNREVKNVLASIGLEVNRLIRVSYGPFQLGDLPESDVQEIPTKTLLEQLGADLPAEAGCDFEAPLFERPRAMSPVAADKYPRRRGLRVKSEDGEAERVMRGGLIEDRHGRRVLVQRVADEEEGNLRSGDARKRHSSRPRKFHARNEDDKREPRREENSEDRKPVFKNRTFDTSSSRKSGEEKPFFKGGGKRRK